MVTALNGRRIWRKSSWYLCIFNSRCSNMHHVKNMSNFLLCWYNYVIVCKHIKCYIITTKSLTFLFRWQFYALYYLLFLKVDWSYNGVASRWWDEATKAFIDYLGIYIYMLLCISSINFWYFRTNKIKTKVISLLLFPYAR